MVLAHPDLSRAVPDRAIKAVVPVIAFNQDGAAGLQQLVAQLRVAGELLPNKVFHHLKADVVPVITPLQPPPQTFGLTGSRCVTDDAALGEIVCFGRLKSMFNRRVFRPVERHSSAVEV